MEEKKHHGGRSFVCVLFPFWFVSLRASFLNIIFCLLVGGFGSGLCLFSYGWRLHELRTWKDDPSDRKDATEIQISSQPKKEPTQPPSCFFLGRMVVWEL